MSATTVTLISIVFCQMGIVFACRSKDESIFSLGFFTNREINYGIIFEIVLLACAIFIPVLNTVVLETNMVLDWKIWLIMLTFPFICLFTGELRKYIKRKRKNNLKLKEGAGL